MNAPQLRARPTPPAGQTGAQADALAELIARTLGHMETGDDIPCTGPDRRAWTLDREADMGHAVDQCHRCPVLTDCAGYALTYAEPAGVWGGLTPNRRAELRAATLAAAA